MGGGTISGYVHAHGHGKQGYNRTINFSIDWHFTPVRGGELGGKAIINPWKTDGFGYLMFVGGVAPNIPMVENGKPYYLSPVWVNFGFYFRESELTPETDQSILATYFLGLIDFKKSNNRIDLNNNVIKIEHKQEEKCNKCSRPASAFVYNGEIFKWDKKKFNFPKDIKPDEPIKTDKKTQLEITMPSKEVIKVAPKTEVIIKSENLIEIIVGKIHKKIKKFIEQRRRAKYLVNTPTCVAAIRDTEFTIDVEDDGTTTVVLLDGEVELSDKENKKTVIVKKSQKSVVKPGALPTESEEIDPKNILKWWE